MKTFIHASQMVNMGDAAQSTSVFFNQQLTLVMTRLFEIKYKQIKYRDNFRINNEGGAGITAIQMTVWDMVGSAKIIGHYSDDLPSAQAGASLVTIPVRWIGASFHFSWMELQQATQAGVPLSDRRAAACNRAIEVKLNNIAYGVDEEATDAGLFGLLNNPNIPESTVAVSVANPGGVAVADRTRWENKTPQEILLDINNAFSTIEVATAGVHSANILSLPIKQYNFLATTQINDLNSDTLMTWLMTNSPWIASMDQIRAQPELSEAGPNGEDVFFVYEDDPEIAEMHIPFEKDTPVGTLPDGIAYKTPMLASTAGLDVRYPLAYSKGLGI